MDVELRIFFLYFTLCLVNPTGPHYTNDLLKISPVHRRLIA
jgi:hypothetical protein